MLIRISIESTQPLAGTVSGRRSEPLHFDGWLELLSRISELVGAETPVGFRDAGDRAMPEPIAGGGPGGRAVPGRRTDAVSDERSDTGSNPIGPDGPNR